MKLNTYLSLFVMLTIAECSQLQAQAACKMGEAEVIKAVQSDGSLAPSLKDVESSISKIYKAGGCLQYFDLSGAGAFFVQGSGFYFEKVPAFRADEYKDPIFKPLGNAEAYRVLKQSSEIKGVSVSFLNNEMAMAAGVVYDKSEDVSENLRAKLLSEKTSKINYLIYPRAFNEDLPIEFVGTLVHEGMHAEDLSTGKMKQLEVDLQNMLKTVDWPDAMQANKWEAFMDFWARMKSLVAEGRAYARQAEYTVKKNAELTFDHSEKRKGALSTQARVINNGLNLLTTGEVKKICDYLGKWSPGLMTSNYGRDTFKHCQDGGLKNRIQVYNAMCTTGGRAAITIVYSGDGKVESVNTDPKSDDLAKEYRAHAIAGKTPERELKWKSNGNDTCYSSLIQEYLPPRGTAKTEGKRTPQVEDEEASDQGTSSAM